MASNTFCGVEADVGHVDEARRLSGHLSFSFEFFFQIVQQAQPLPFEFPHPPFVNVVERHGIDEMQFFAATPDRADQIRRFQYFKMLRGRLPGHVQVFAELAERLAVLFAEQVEELAARRIAQRFEDLVASFGAHRDPRRQYAGKYLHVKAL